MSDTNELVTITKEEYHRLCRDALKLDYLERGGVGSWNWCEASLEGYEEEVEKNGWNDDSGE